jgi:hypothetical protein
LVNGNITLLTVMLKVSLDCSADLAIFFPLSERVKDRFNTEIKIMIKGRMTFMREAFSGIRTSS